MLVRRRIGIITSLVEECGLQVRMSLVPSANNRADVLTHVLQQWLKVSTTDSTAVCMAMEDSTEEFIRRIHNSVGHSGVRCTLYFVKKANVAVTRRQV